jgi:hypothetical protein
MTNSMPKYLQAKFNSKKAITTINPEHENFVRKTIKRMFDFNAHETGARYASEIEGSFRAFKNEEKAYIVVLTHTSRNYYIVKLN